MDKQKQLETFVAVAQKGSLSAAASAQGVAPALIGRRIDALEKRLGVKLITRTTRKLTLTSEGAAFLEDCQRILADIADAEAAVSVGGTKPTGILRITAPAGFGRQHVAPLVTRFLAIHPDVIVSLDLTDRLVDIVAEGVDLAIRIGNLDDSNLIAVKLAENRRVVVGSPQYLKRFGKPRSPHDLQQHRCLTFGNGNSQPRGWLFKQDGEIVAVKVNGTIECNDGAVLHDWALKGHGLAWRSMWEVGSDLKSGRLTTVLDEFAPPDNAIYALFPSRRHLPLRVRLFVEMLKTTYGSKDYWSL